MYVNIVLHVLSLTTFFFRLQSCTFFVFIANNITGKCRGIVGPISEVPSSRVRTTTVPNIVMATISLAYANTITFSFLGNVSKFILFEQLIRVLKTNRLICNVYPNLLTFMNTWIKNKTGVPFHFISFFSVKSFTTDVVLVSHLQLCSQLKAVLPIVLCSNPDVIHVTTRR